MIKKTINYTDYNGIERSEDFYFNLTEAELAEMQMEASGGLGERLKRIVAAKDFPAIIKAFKEIILKAYGVKSDDGRRFIKNQQLTEEFTQTEAYSKLFMELSSNDQAAAEFINGIVPASIAKELEAQNLLPSA